MSNTNGPGQSTSDGQEEGTAERYARLLARVQRQNLLSNGLFLHYDGEIEDLRCFLWPVNEQGRRVTPSGFFRYRLSHNFQGPCCFCAVESRRREVYTESAIFISDTVKFHGEYVAACASGRCKYLVPIERLYARAGLFIFQYPRRDATCPAPPPVIHVSEIKPNHTGINTLLALTPKYERPMPPVSIYMQVLDLDKHGLPEADFVELVVRCGCGMVMTKRVLKSHQCLKLPVVIDLTKDDV